MRLNYLTPRLLDDLLYRAEKILSKILKLSKNVGKQMFETEKWVGCRSSKIISSIISHNVLINKWSNDATKGSETDLIMCLQVKCELVHKC